MEKAEIKLELLKLVFRHDRTAAQVVETAKELERYVSDDNSAKSEKVDTAKPEPFKKKKRNSGFFS